MMLVDVINQLLCGYFKEKYSLLSLLTFTISLGFDMGNSQRLEGNKNAVSLIPIQ
jgi:hypothetical protein